MGFKTIPFNDYLTITHFTSATPEDGAVDFSNYGSEDGTQVADGFQVQRDLMDLDAKGKVGYWDQQKNEIIVVELTQKIRDEIQKARSENPYLKSLQSQTEPQEPLDLDEITVNWNNDYGPTINIGCFNQGAYRQFKEAPQITNYLASDKCPICGGKRDSFQSFLKMIAHASQSDLWQSFIWETVGGRSTHITFSVKTYEVKKINLKELFLQAGDRVSYLNLTSFFEGESPPKTRPVLPDKSIERVNANQLLHVYGWIDQESQVDNEMEQVGVNGYFIWLPKDRVEEFYQLHLAIRSFYDQFYDASIIFAYTSFEYYSNKLKKSIKRSMGVNSEEWDELWEQAKGNDTPHWKFALDSATDFLGLRNIDDFSPSLKETIIKLKRSRNDVAHKGMLENPVSHEDVFNQICSSIFISQLCRSIVAVLTSENQRIRLDQNVAIDRAVNNAEELPDCLPSRHTSVII